MAKVNGAVELFDITAVPPTTLPPRTREGAGRAPFTPRPELLAQVADLLTKGGGGIAGNTLYGSVAEARKACANVAKYAGIYAASLTPEKTVNLVFIDEAHTDENGKRDPIRVSSKSAATDGQSIRWAITLGEPRKPRTKSAEATA